MTSQTKVHSCLFEAASIQGYILATGRLKEIVGASGRVDALCGQVLDAVLAGLGEELSSRVHFARRAGGAFYALSEDADAIEALFALWPLVVNEYAPGLEFLLAQGEGATPGLAIGNARESLQGSRMRFSGDGFFPGPFVERARNTGRAAVAIDDKERIDAVSLSKREFQEGNHDFVRRFAPASEPVNWPLDLSGSGKRAFPYLSREVRELALVHADGNSLGAIVQAVQEALADLPLAEYASRMRQFSDAIGQATENAATEAVAHAVESHRDSGTYPARPIVLGGDDLTILVRADLALAFAESFLGCFERHTAEQLGRVADHLGVRSMPRGLTACAGIVTIGAHQPISHAQVLAEDLCGEVKKRAKALAQDGKVPSALGFYRTTANVPASYDQVMAEEWVVHMDGEEFHQGLVAYGVAADGPLPALSTLKDLAVCLMHEESLRGALRQVVGLVGRDPVRARSRYRRLLAVSHQGMASVNRLVQALVPGEPHADLPFRKVDHDKRAPWCTPLGDALALCSLHAVAGTRDAVEHHEETA
ncbi:MAG TPA: hypothetical protein PKZ76_13590 [Xanthomonadaceae bacterium]|nr:hypothetical protein [Xanthomonadaceae bacterium]